MKKKHPPKHVPVLIPIMLCPWCDKSFDMDAGYICCPYCTEGNE